MSCLGGQLSAAPSCRVGPTAGPPFPCWSSRLLASFPILLNPIRHGKTRGTERRVKVTRRGGLTGRGVQEVEEEVEEEDNLTLIKGVLRWRQRSSCGGG